MTCGSTSKTKNAAWAPTVSPVVEEVTCGSCRRLMRILSGITAAAQRMADVEGDDRAATAAASIAGRGLEARPAGLAPERLRDAVS